MRDWPLLGVVDRAVRIGTDLMGRSLPYTFGDDGFGCEAARLELRPLRLLLVLRLSSQIAVYLVR